MSLLGRPAARGFEDVAFLVVFILDTQVSGERTKLADEGHVRGAPLGENDRAQPAFVDFFDHSSVKPPTARLNERQTF